MDKLMGYVEKLSVDIGPRGSATAEEKRAADYLAAEMKSMGYDVSYQNFNSVTSFSWAFAIYYGLFVVAALIFRYNAPLAFVLALLNGIAYLLECHTFEVYTRLVPKRPSRNVIARLPAREGSKRLIVLTAHYDSSRAALNFSPKMVKNFRQSFILMNLSMLLIVILYAFSLIAAQTGWDINPLFFWYASWPFALYLLTTVGFLAHRELFCRFTPGANDNASGVAAMLGAMAEAAQNPPEHLELWAVATGAEEAGTVGMLRFLGQYGTRLKDALFINLDNLGAGELKYVVAEGMFKALASDQELVEAAEKASRETGVPASPFIYRALTTDAMPALARGYKTLSIMAFSDNILPNWHWYTDTIDHVSAENLTHAKDLVTGILRVIDSKC